MRSRDVRSLTYPLISRRNRGQRASKSDHFGLTSTLPRQPQNHKKWNLHNKTYFHSFILSAHFKVFDIPVSKYCQYYELHRTLLLRSSLVSYYSCWSSYCYNSFLYTKRVWAESSKNIYGAMKLLASCIKAEHLHKLFVPGFTFQN